MSLTLRLFVLLVLLLAIQVQVLLTQGEPIEPVKKNPIMKNIEITKLQQDSSIAKKKIVQQPLPKFDLPEFVITGTASIDLSKLEKYTIEDSAIVPPLMLKSHEKDMRDRETLELEMNSGKEELQINNYLGFVKAGIGTYFTPQAELYFGQSISDYFYSFDGRYFLTKGYAQYTDQSSGSITALGGMTLTSSNPLLLQNATLNGKFGYQSKTFNFFGSATPNLQRTLSDFQFHVGLENQALDYFSYSAGITLESLDISDSSASKNETRLDLNYQTLFRIASLPIQTKLQLMSVSGGLGFMDLSTGLQNYWYGNLLFEGSIHLNWAKGMAGQDIVHLCPNLMIGYQITSRHRVYLSYEPMLVPMTLASNIIINRYLSDASIVKSEYISNAGEIGIESNWTDAINSRISLNVKSARDLPVFSDSLRRGVWMLVYGANTTITTFCAEMVAKLNSNDYFASNILLCSTYDSFLGSKIPYAPAIEVWCSEKHRFGTEITVSGEINFIGERTTDLAGTNTLPKFAVIDISGEYTPISFLKLTTRIKNLTDSKYEIWRGYKEFPLTMQVDVQIKW